MTEAQSTTDHSRSTLAFLLDVDNTLLDNDRLKNDIGEHVEKLVGEAGAERFWSIYEQVRGDEDYVDYPATIKRYAETCDDPSIAATLWQILEEMDFASYLYPGALEVIKHLSRLGTVAILSDGDGVFQPLKIEKSGLRAAVDGHVLIFVHKEDELPQVFAVFPADHYVMVDDKQRILSALEDCCPTTFTTVAVMQGHFATRKEYIPRPDFTIDDIASLLDFNAEQFQSNTSTKE